MKLLLVGLSFSLTLAFVLGITSIVAGYEPHCLLQTGLRVTVIGGVVALAALAAPSLLENLW